MGAFRAGRSDLDFVAVVAVVAVVAGDLERVDLARVRTVHLGRWISALVRDTVARWGWPFVCTGSRP
jgi:hypothetical protein